MSVYDEIQAERERQDAKWGEQNHPIVQYEGQGADEECFAHYALPTEEVAKRQCDSRNFMKTLSWPDIVTEEYCEAITKLASGDTVGGREELVQLAAVVHQWIECIDRNGGAK